MSSMEECTSSKTYTTSIMRLCSFAVMSAIGWKDWYSDITPITKWVLYLLLFGLHPFVYLLSNKVILDSFHSLFQKPSWCVALQNKISHKRHLALITYYAYQEVYLVFYHKDSFYFPRTPVAFLLSGTFCNRFIIFFIVQKCCQWFPPCMKLLRKDSSYIKINSRISQKYWALFQDKPDSSWFSQLNIGYPMITLSFKLSDICTYSLRQCVIQDKNNKFKVFILQKKILTCPCCYLHNENLKTRLHRWRKWLNRAQHRNLPFLSSQ